MSTHPAKKTRAPETQAKSFPAFIRGQNSKTDAPDHYLPLEECRELTRQGLGRFINRGQAFSRWDTSQPRAHGPSVGASGRRGDSLKIDEPASPSTEMGMMSRFVEGDQFARAALAGWKPKRRSAHKLVTKVEVRRLVGQAC